MHWKILKNMRLGVFRLASGRGKACVSQCVEEEIEDCVFRWVREETKDRPLGDE